MTHCLGESCALLIETLNGNIGWIADAGEKGLSMAGRDHSHLRLDRTVVRDPPVACGPHTCVRYRTGP